MNAIPASSVSLKTMADGTLRISFDFEPAQAKDAFNLFAAPGTPVAIAALKVGYEAKSAEPEKPKGGALSKLAGMWCEDVEFQQWTDSRTSVEAAEYIRGFCKIESRAELDHDDDAAERFQRLIRGPYMKHLAARGIVQ